MRLRFALPVLAFCFTAQAVVVDRIAAVVGNTAVKDSDIERDIRLTSFLNGQKSDFSLKSRRDSANRLIDQLLIRREIEAGQPAVSPAPEAERLLAQLRKDRFPSQAEYRKAMSEYGITEADLKSRLIWQLTVLGFIDSRFRPGVVVADEDVQKYFQDHQAELKTNNYGRSDGPENFRPEIENAIAGERINQQFYAWLEQRRKETKVAFREETLR